jgi:hypothetical protein
MHNPTGKRHGIIAVIAMLYLAIFAILAVGYYESCNIAAIVSMNENSSAVALSATESGMDFMRYQMSGMNLPFGTNTANLLNNTATSLGSQLNGTANMTGSTVAVSGGAINIPSATKWIVLESASGAKFRGTITQKAGTSTLVVTVHGMSKSGVMTRGVQMEYKPSSRSHVLVGTSSVAMSNSAFTDSYDSSKGPYNAATAGKKGSISSNGNITLSNTSKINGDARPGPGKTVTIAPTASVTGSTLPMHSIVTYPSVVLPASGVTALPDINMSSGTMNVPGGVYSVNNINLSGTAVVNWTGPVTLYVKASYKVQGNVVINTYQNLPKNRVINFLPTCVTATWNGTNVCVGDLYAPDTAFVVSGSVQKFGRIIAKTISNSSTGGMHADDSLVPPGGMGSYDPDPSTYQEIP